VHLQPPVDEVAPVRALAEVVGQARKRRAKIRSLGGVDERDRQVAPYLLLAELQSIALDRDRRVFSS
jgi:hypothetical protein